jgi:hypothetical protein
MYLLHIFKFWDTFEGTFLPVSIDKDGYIDLKSKNAYSLYTSKKSFGIDIFRYKDDATKSMLAIYFCVVPIHFYSAEYGFWELCSFEDRQTDTRLTRRSE